MSFGALLQIVRDIENIDPNTVAYTSNVRVGSLLVAYFSSADGITLVPTDSLGNTYALAIAQEEITFASKMHMYYAYSRSAGANTVTFSGAASLVIYIAEYEGPFEPAGPLDPLTGVGADGATGTLNSGNFTTTWNEEVLLGFFFGQFDITVAGGWTADADAEAAPAFFLVSRRIRATAVDAASATMAAGVWIAIAAAFRKGSIGGLLQFGMGV